MITQEDILRWSLQMVPHNTLVYAVPSGWNPMRLNPNSPHFGTPAPLRVHSERESFPELLSSKSQSPFTDLLIACSLSYST